LNQDVTNGSRGLLEVGLEVVHVALRRGEVGVTRHPLNDVHRNSSAEPQRFRHAGRRRLRVFDVAIDQDKSVWRQRQEQLNTDFGTGLTIDGIPGQKTVTALIESGRPSGLWIRRPDNPDPGLVG
jgi:hypothetical protein